METPSHNFPIFMAKPLLACNNIFKFPFRILSLLDIILYYHFQGRRPRGTGGTAPPKKFEVGDGPCIGPTNILRISVVGWVRKLEQSKKNRCQGILF